MEWSGAAVAYTFAESRSAREVEGQLSSFAGVLQVDGYQAYKTLAKRRGKSNIAPMRLAFCLAHARRKFVDVMRELKVQLTELSEEVSSKSALGKAVSYALNHWNGLAAFLEDGRIEADSNVVERSMKSVALTRNYAKLRIMRRYRGGNSTAAVSATIIST